MRVCWEYSVLVSVLVSVLACDSGCIRFDRGVLGMVFRPGNRLEPAFPPHFALGYHLGIAWVSLGS